MSYYVIQVDLVEYFRESVRMAQETLFTTPRESDEFDTIVDILAERQEMLKVKLADRRESEIYGKPDPTLYFHGARENQSGGFYDYNQALSIIATYPKGSATHYIINSKPML